MAGVPRRQVGAGPLTASGVQLTVDAVRELADRMVTDELVVIGVRHHSPACARVVERAIAERRPSVVLVEGPRSFDPLIPLLVHPEARMPLAVYTYARAEDRRQAGYYPFADYSPELVALRAAAQHQVPARFCDLDLVEQHDDTAAPTGRSLLDEHRYAHSERLADLASQLGCKDAEDLWELLFETGETALDLTEHAARVCAYAAPSRREATPDDLVADGTAAREAEMAHHVRAALDARGPGDGPVLVVVGAFHALVLPDLLADPPPRPTIDRAGAETGQAIIRYTFDRLERLNGYGAGMTSPGWYQRLWQGGGRSDEPFRVTAVVDALMDIVVAVRADGHEVPMPSAQAALEHALRLADLRGHARPLRSDLLDAVTACLVRGEVAEDAPVLAIARRVLTGTAVGAVPPGAGQPPLVADALARARASRLEVDQPGRSTLALDLYRKAAHRATSRLLHGLALLGAPLGVRTAGPDFVSGTGLGRLQERWEYGWGPFVEGALVEAAVYGSTVPEAVAARFDDQLRRLDPGAGPATSALARALVLGLHGHAAQVVPVVRVALGAEPSFVEAVAAAGRLALLVESAEPLEAEEVTDLPDLLAAAYQRAVYLGGDLAGEAAAVVAALVRLRELLVSRAGSNLDPDLYWAVVRRAASRADAQVRGAAAGLLVSGGLWTSDDLAGALRGVLAGGTDQGVEFVVGLLATARETAWQEPAVIETLDGFLRDWDEQAFLEKLPSLRLAFSELTPRETDRVAAAVAVRHGAASLGPLVQRDVSESQVLAWAAASATARDLLARDGLGGWVP